MDRLLPDEFPFKRRRAETSVTIEAAAPTTALARVTSEVSVASVLEAAATGAPVAGDPKAVAPAKPQAAGLAVVEQRAGEPTTAMTVASAAKAADAVETAGYKGPERRRSPRQLLKAKAIYRGDLNPAGAGPVQLVNVSLCGVRLWSNRPLKIGERGTVRMEVGPVKWSSRVKIISCDSDGDQGFAVGCEFAASEVSRRRVA